MLLAKEADIVSLPRELQPQALDQGFQIITSMQGANQTALAFGSLFFDPEGGVISQELPWKDVRVREAMNRALNCDEMMDVLYAGRAEKLPVFNRPTGIVRNAACCRSLIMPLTSWRESINTLILNIIDDIIYSQQYCTLKC